MKNGNSSTSPKRRTNPKQRNQLHPKSSIRNLSISLCGIILSSFVGLGQVNAQNWFDEMPSPDKFKQDMDKVWIPIKDQYLPYGLGLMALGLLLRKI